MYNLMKMNTRDSHNLIIVFIEKYIFSNYWEERNEDFARVISKIKKMTDELE